ncbi:MAG: hypothetical protein LBN25_03990, partial [Christensenellaceae bacterium]|jgi:hypothetical protein|nr:hypothetical protein [Christensenellaceae bacterium]
VSPQDTGDVILRKALANGTVYDLVDLEGFYITEDTAGLSAEDVIELIKTKYPHFLLAGVYEFNVTLHTPEILAWSDGYANSTRKLKVRVEKAVPAYPEEIPSFASVTVGTSSGELLSAGSLFTMNTNIYFEYPGKMTVELTYNTEDSANYYPITGIRVPVTVVKYPCPVATVPVISATLVSGNRAEVTNLGAGYYYSKDGGASWQESNVFAALMPDTAYYFAVKYGETDFTEGGVVSETVGLTTPKATVVDADDEKNGEENFFQSTKFYVVLAVVAGVPLLFLLFAIVYKQRGVRWFKWVIEHMDGSYEEKS